ncbi:MAG: hypothetical protein IT355_14915 [Gemmatimonadaceae bacterium]|nr:hypothetical protein [Gemmatimonadaceae bacterium]
MRFPSILAGALSAVFGLLALRLLVTTQGMRGLRSLDEGALVGSAVFALLALLFGVLAARLWRMASASRHET